MWSRGEVTLREANVDDRYFISRMFHAAMLMEDTPEDRIHEFGDLICSRHDVLYSSDNSTIAIVDDKPVGMVTAYDGRNYHDWRVKTFQLVRDHLGIEFPGMEEEAVPGEFYIDSLAVLPECRGMGIGTLLLECAIAKGRSLGLKCTLAVDPDNPQARKLYESLGFMEDGTLFLFGHNYTKMSMN